MSQIKLSIIMPLFNVERTIRLALDSVLMQKVDFEYEIIAIDDASTDNTISILQEYARKHKNIKIIAHTENKGNAIAFYDGLVASSGDYFCVLDGDDYYTIKSKLQKQVDFLDGDKSQEYFAVSHKYLRVNEKFQIFDDPMLYTGPQEYTYLDVLLINFYSHTTTYMYRNIFRGQVPEKFKEPLYRGDNPRTFMHGFYSKGKVKNLDFVGSVYFYNGQGIWSQTSRAEQDARNIKMRTELGGNLNSDIERTIYWLGMQKIRVVNRSAVIRPPYGSGMFQDATLFFDYLTSRAKKYAFSQKDFIFQGLYKSEYIDTFCESLGFVEMVRRGYTPSQPVEPTKDNILITVSKLTTTGGGVYHEIKDIIAMYADKNVYLLWTDVPAIDDLDDKVRNQLGAFDNLTMLFGPKSAYNKLAELVDTVLTVKPEKIYHYCGHDNVYAAAMIQSMLSKNICVFSFDHGFSLGLDNTNYDVYITKRPTDYDILTERYGDKVIYIPCWNADKIGDNKYKPFNGHNGLITASAAARYYKLASGGGGYIDLIIELLKKTGGRHIHYGPIPDEEKRGISKKLSTAGLQSDQFVNIEWAENLGQSMYDEHVDVFIEPFPTVSYKITLDVLSAGIPVFVHKSDVRMGITDFIYQECLAWKTPEDFVTVLTSLTQKDLGHHSKLSRDYYVKNHRPATLVKSFITESNFSQPRTVKILDNLLVDTSNIDAFLGTDIQKFLPKTPVDKSVPAKKILVQHYHKSFVANLRLKQRFKVFTYSFLLMLAQVPLLDLLCRSNKRKKLLGKINKYFR